MGDGFDLENWPNWRPGVILPPPSRVEFAPPPPAPPAWRDTGTLVRNAPLWSPLEVFAWWMGSGFAAGIVLAIVTYWIT